MQIFSAVIGHTQNLTHDVFGNYVIQKLFEYGTPVMKKVLAEQLVGDVLNMCYQLYIRARMFYRTSSVAAYLSEYIQVVAWVSVAHGGVRRLHVCHFTKRMLATNDPAHSILCPTKKVWLPRCSESSGVRGDGAEDASDRYS